MFNGLKYIGKNVDMKKVLGLFPLLRLYWIITTIYKTTICMDGLFFQRSKSGMLLRDFFFFARLLIQKLILW